MAYGNETKFTIRLNTITDLKGVQQLQKELQELKKYATVDTTSSYAEMSKLISSANKVESALKSAYNPKINTLNLDKFNKTLKQQDTNLTKIYQDFSLAGSQGKQAFLQLGNVIAQSNQNLKKMETSLDRLGTAFVNAFRYQVINGIIHNLQGSVSEAFGYVKQLDKSLNAIQIVTEKSTASMKGFAKEANKAAQSLGAGTRDYTDASLIYFQQGLDDAAVKARTETTVKMANVLGEDSAQVSDYMTSIWNNFAEGSSNLEYFGDVITNLGANTASSATEIAEGLSKFAAVADTVGISYETASASIATVVAETRQSADTVGTAFKTIFSRIQDLEQGKSLDDGTTLGKYSQALLAVGVNIKDTSGKLKSMDQILEETGQKWKTLSEEQRMALSQNVAGSRQYVQFTALMDNWDKVKKNIDLAADSTGTLQKKQEIYMDSVAAHEEKQRAAMENLYDSLIDPESIKIVADAIAAIANGAAGFTDAMGGGIGLLTSFGSIATQVFSSQIANGLDNLITKFRDVVGLVQQSKDGLNQIRLSHLDVDFGTDKNMKANWDKLVTINEEKMKRFSLLSPELKQVYGQLEQMATQIGVAKNEYEDFRNNVLNKKGSLTHTIFGRVGDDVDTASKKIKSCRKEIEDIEKAFYKGGDLDSVKFKRGSIFRDIDFQKLNTTGQLAAIENAKNIVSQYQEYISKVENVKHQENTLNGMFQETNKKADAVAFYNSIVKVTGAIGGLQSAVVNFSRLPALISDENISGFEKFNRVLTTLTVSGGQLVYSFSNLAPLMISDFSLMIKARTALSNAQKLGISLQSIQNTKEANAVIIQKLVAAGYTKEAAARELTLIKMGKQISLQTILNSLTPMGWALIAAGIAAATVALVHYTSATEQLKRANKAYEEQNQKVKELSTELDEIQKKINELNSKDKLQLTEKDDLERLKAEKTELKAELEIQKELNKEKEKDKARAGERLVSEGNLGYGSRPSISYEDHGNYQKEVEYTLEDRKNDYKTYKEIFNTEGVSEATRNKIQSETKLAWSGDLKPYFESTFEELAKTYDKSFWNQDNEAIIAELEKNQKLFIESGAITTKDFTELVKESFFDSEGVANSSFEAVYEGIVSGSKKAVDAVSSNFAELEKKLSGLKFGDLVDNLDGFSDIIKSFFVETADGFKLLGNPEKIKDILRQEKINSLIQARKEDINAAEQRKETAEKNAKKYEKAQIDYSYSIGSAADYEQEKYDKDKEKWIGSEGAFDRNNQGRKAAIDALKEYGDVTGIISLLKEAGVATEDWEAKIKDGNATVTEYNEVLNAFSTLVENNKKIIEETQDAQVEEDIKIANTCNTLEELTDLQNKAAESGHELSRVALETARNNIINANEMKNLDMEEFNELSKEYKKQLDSNTAQAEVFTKSILRMNSGISKLQKNFKTWGDILSKNTDQLSTESINAYKDVKDAVADLLDTSSDFLQNDFIKNNLNLIQQASTGDANSIDSLRESFESSNKIELNLNSDLYDQAVEQLSSLEEGQEIVIEGKVNLDTEKGVAALNEMFLAANATAGDIQRTLDGMGYEPIWEEEQVEQTQTIPIDKTTTETAGFYQENGIDAGNHPFTISVPNYVTKTEHTEEEVSAGSKSMIAIGTNGNPPKIKGVRKKANASHANKGSSGGSGGGGGGSSKAPKAQKPKDLDRYHTVNKNLADTERELKKLSDRQATMSGGELIASLERENELLEQQAKDLQAIDDIAREEMAELQEELSKEGFSFYDNGNFANFEEVNKKLNEEFEKRNQDMLDGKIAEEAFNEWKKKYYDPVFELESKYDEALKKHEENTDKQEELARKQISNNLKSYETEIKLRLDSAEMERDWSDFITKINEDFTKSFKNFDDKWENLLTKGYSYADDTIQTNLETIEKYTKELNKLENGGTSEIFHNPTEAAEKLKEANKSLQESAEALFDLYKEAWDTYLEDIDQAISKMDELQEAFERIANELDHQEKVIELLFGENQYDKLGNVYNMQTANILAQMNASRTEIETLQESYIDAVANFGEESEAAVKIYEEVLNEQEKLNGYIESYVENLIKVYENTLSKSMQNMEKNLFGDTIDNVSEEWEDAKKAAEGYYDETERIYQLEKMQNKWQNAVNSASSLKTQRLMKEYMDSQLKSLADKTELSEYDISLAEKRLAVYKAQADLEDAQNNKNTMKLVRNTAGNWVYSYVANANDIEDKKQAILDAENEVYEFTKTSFQNTTESLLNTWNDYKERLSQAYKELRTAESAEEKASAKTKLNRIQNLYTGDNGLLTKTLKNQSSMRNDMSEETYVSNMMSYLLDNDVYNQMSEEQKKLILGGTTSLEELRNYVNDNYDEILSECESFNENSVISWGTSLASIKVSVEDFSNEAINLYNQMDEAFTNYSQNLLAAEEASGIAFTDVNKIIAEQATKIDEASTAVEKYAGTINTELNDAIGIVNAMANAWDSVKENISATIRETNDLVEKTLANIEKLNGSDGNVNPSTPNGSNRTESQNFVSTAGSGGSDGGVSSLSPSYINPTSSPKTNNRYKTIVQLYGEADDNGSFHKKYNGYIVASSDKVKEGYLETEKELYDREGGKYYRYTDVDGAYFYTVEKLKWEKYDTGGYTGEWNSSGRLAMLHQKELVLNETDTQNILSAVDMMRKISNIGNTVTSSIGSGIKSIIASIFGNSSISIPNTAQQNNNNTSNTYNVTANFPNANNADDIREAILSLPTLASQYLGDK